MAIDLTTMDATKPDGATEQVKTLDNYLREVRANLKDWGDVEHDLATGAHQISIGNTAARPAVITGRLYVNTQTGYLEYYNGTAWVNATDAILKTLVDAKGDIIVASAADTVVRVAVGTNGKALVADSAEAAGVKWDSISTTGSYRVIGADCKNNATTPNTQFDLDADVVILRNSANAIVVRHNPGAAIVNNILTAGPAANGRDQAGAFLASSWVHFYWVWDGTTLATVSSTVAPPTGPTLPTGYTHWAYAGAVRLDGASAMIKVRIKGSKVHYEAAQVAVANGVATVETTVSLSALIPPNALTILLRGDTAVVAGSDAGDVVKIRYITGADYMVLGIPSNIVNANNTLMLELPNVSQQVFYLWVIVDTASNFDLDVLGYTIPNGE